MAHSDRAKRQILRCLLRGICRGGLSAVHSSRARDVLGSISRSRDPSQGVRVIRTPIRTPVANAYAERFVQTVRRECLDWMLIGNERHLRCVDFLEHYHHERPHRGLKLRPPNPANQTSSGPVQRRDRLDALLQEYYRTAAEVEPSIETRQARRPGGLDASRVSAYLASSRGPTRLDTSDESKKRAAHRWPRVDFLQSLPMCHPSGSQ
jgi:hypothetical protein